MKTTVSQFHKIRAMMRKLFRYPSLDWYFMLSCFAVCLVFAFVFNTFIYVKFVTQTSADVFESASKPALLDKGEIEDTLKQTKQRSLNAKTVPMTVRGSF